MKDKEQEKKKIYREMLLQEVSPPNHGIRQFRGNAVALLDQVSHSSPKPVVLELAERADVKWELSISQKLCFEKKKKNLRLRCKLISSMSN